MKNFVERK